MIEHKEWTPHDWYWHITDGAHRVDDPRPVPMPDQVYSSAKGAFVPVTDPDYVTWLTQWTAPTQIDTEDQVAEILKVRDQAFGVPAA